MVGRSQVAGVLDGTGGEQRLPVVLFERSAHPFGGNDDHIGILIDEGTGHLGKAQVVAGHQSETHAGDLQGRRRVKLARLDPV